MKIRVYNILKKTKVEGPGLRYCIWTQGCSRHCRGCQAVHTWSHKGGVLLETDDIVDDILSQKDIEGVTFLGGEPFEQEEALASIAKAVQEQGLSVLTFTGNLYEEVKDTELVKYTDLLIDGAFEIDKLDYSRPWCGSLNQRYHFLTDRYSEEILEKYKNKVEVNISESGAVFINGMGNFDDILKKIDLTKLKI